MFGNVLFLLTDLLLLVECIYIFNFGTYSFYLCRDKWKPHFGAVRFVVQVLFHFFFFLCGELNRLSLNQGEYNKKIKSHLYYKLH